MWTISETVDITMSIITDIGSSMMPRSMCRPPPNGSQTVFHGMRVWKTPEPSLPAPKYENAVHQLRRATAAVTVVPMPPATPGLSFVPRSPSNMKLRKGSTSISIVYSIIVCQRFS